MRASKHVWNWELTDENLRILIDRDRDHATEVTDEFKRRLDAILEQVGSWETWALVQLLENERIAQHSPQYLLDYIDEAKIRKSAQMINRGIRRIWGIREFSERCKAWFNEILRKVLPESFVDQFPLDTFIFQLESISDSDSIVFDISASESWVSINFTTSESPTKTLWLRRVEKSWDAVEIWEYTGKNNENLLYLKFDDDFGISDVDNLKTWFKHLLRAVLRNHSIGISWNTLTLKKKIETEV